MQYSYSNRASFCDLTQGIEGPSCLCRPANVQIADIVSYATYQASGTNIARVLAKQTGDHKA